MRITRLLAGAVALAISLPVAGLAASAKAPPKKPPMHVPARFPDSITHGSVVVHGKTIHYTARAGTITLHNQANQPTARIFYVAYTKDGAQPSNRPVTFFYNGGPGSSTMWLHMGSFGPVRVISGSGTLTGPPPYRIVPNGYTLLDKTDEVFIDMPDSGFGRIIGAGKQKMFFGVDQDARAFAQFAQNYIGKFGRWNSPKYLFGESYGTTRDAALAADLQQDGVGLNGVVFQSSILNFNLDWSVNFGYVPAAVGGGDWGFVLYFPTEAATAWYHHAVPNRPAHLRPFLARVERFTMGPYLTALAQGDALPQSQRMAIANKIHEYTGLSLQYILNANLRIPYGRFENQLLRNSGKIVGRLDSRYETTTIDGNQASAPWDPTDAAIDDPFTAAVNQYLRVTLKYNPPIPYRSSVYNIIAKSGGWNWKHNGMQPTNVAPDIAFAMTNEPSMKVFVAMGYYDFATPYEAALYTFEHLGIPPSLQRNITYRYYRVGHMIYLNPQSLAHYQRDLDAWYSAP